MHVSGPTAQDDLVAAWIDAPYLGRPAADHRPHRRRRHGRPAAGDPGQRLGRDRPTPTARAPSGSTGSIARPALDGGLHHRRRLPAAAAAGDRRRRKRHPGRAGARRRAADRHRLRGDAAGRHAGRCADPHRRQRATVRRRLRRAARWRQHQRRAHADDGARRRHARPAAHAAARRHRPALQVHARRRSVERRTRCQRRFRHAAVDRPRAGARSCRTPSPRGARRPTPG